MNSHKTAALGWIATALFLIGCFATGIPLKLPSVSGPAVPSIPAIVVPTVSVPSVTLPTVVMPTIGVPAMGLTALNGIVSTPAPTATAVPAVPVTGSNFGGEILKWILYGLLALIGIAVVVALFARALKHPEGPDEPPDRPDL